MSKSAVASKQTRRAPIPFRDAPEYTGLTERFLRRLVTEKRIPHMKMSEGRSGRIFFDPDKLDEWLASREVPVDV